MAKVIVCGHKNPDNDAIMSAVGYAWLKNQVDPNNEYQASCLGPLPKESQAIFEKHGVEPPVLIDGIEPSEVKQKLILCDHNELSQTVDGIENAELIEILDHHRVADIQTPNPILFLNLPIGSTSTIVCSRFNHYGVEYPKGIAACLLSAILTDTVILKSPTATQFDRKIVAELAEVVGVDPIEYGKWVFSARGTDDFTLEQIVSRDTKKFEIGSRHVFIGQFETVNKDKVLSNTAELLKEMEKYRESVQGDTMVLLITDILEEGSQVFVVGEKSFVEEALNFTSSEEGVWMPGVLSRKKQIAAPLIAKGM